MLDSHRGYDAGALVMARSLARAFAAPLVSSTVSRLLVDLNRSIGHPRIFSPVVRNLPAPARAAIVEKYYLPYRKEVERWVEQATARRRRVIHISSHSFTPVLDGQIRRADIGLLYHPARPGEVLLSDRWKAALATLAPGVRVRRNYPYAGKGDGLTSHLRQRFSSSAYVGIELEVNQKIVLAAASRWTALRHLIVASLRAASTS